MKLIGDITRKMKKRAEFIYVGADHAGFALKEKIKKWLSSNYNVNDVGNYEYDKKDDYPDFAWALGKKVVKNKSSAGILFCGSGQGVCIAANKIKGIRAVSVNNEKDAKQSREHGNANVLCLSGWNLNEEKSKKIIHVFLNTKFSNEPRHIRRLMKIKIIENRR